MACSSKWGGQPGIRFEAPGTGEGRGNKVLWSLRTALPFALVKMRLVGPKSSRRVFEGQKGGRVVHYRKDSKSTVSRNCHRSSQKAMVVTYAITVGTNQIRGKEGGPASAGEEGMYFHSSTK